MHTCAERCIHMFSVTNDCAGYDDYNYVQELILFNGVKITSRMTFKMTSNEVSLMWPAFVSRAELVRVGRERVFGWNGIVERASYKVQPSACRGGMIYERRGAIEFRIVGNMQGAGEGTMGRDRKIVLQFFNVHMDWMLRS